MTRCSVFVARFLKKGIRSGVLVREGFGDWIHLSGRLKEHETSTYHLPNMATWMELRVRLQKNETIDKVAQE